MQKKTLQIIYWVLTILFFGFLAVGAVFELMQTESAQKAIMDLGYPIYLNYILGIAKILGFIAIIQWKWTTIKEWAYAGFTIDILGATGSVFFTGLGFGAVVFTLVFLIPLFLSYYLWKRISAMN